MKSQILNTCGVLWRYHMKISIQWRLHRPLETKAILIAAMNGQHTRLEQTGRRRRMKHWTTNRKRWENNLFGDRSIKASSLGCRHSQGGEDAWRRHAKEFPAPRRRCSGSFFLAVGGLQVRRRLWQTGATRFSRKGSPENAGRSIVSGGSSLSHSYTWRKEHASSPG